MRLNLSCEFNPSLFSSRKLLELTVGLKGRHGAVEYCDCRACAAANELLSRGHYLTELADRGLIPSAHKLVGTCHQRPAAQP